MYDVGHVNDTYAMSLIFFNRFLFVYVKGMVWKMMPLCSIFLYKTIDGDENVMDGCMEVGT